MSYTNLVRRPLRGKPQTARSLAASFNDAAFPFEQFTGYSVHVVWTGTPTGTVKLQGSNNAMDDNVFNGELSTAVWTDISGTSVSMGGVAGSQLWNVAGAYYEAVRVVYTFAAGAGTMQLWYIGKE
jgi:hypothetical protein